MELSEQPNSICHVQAIQIYQLPGHNYNMDLPFALLDGEAVTHHGNSASGLMVLTNYRLFLQLCESQHHIPLGLIETVEHKDLIYLQIGCKDARTYRCCFSNSTDCMDWHGRLLKTFTVDPLENVFAFCYYVFFKENRKEEWLRLECNKHFVYDEVTLKKEVDRLQFNMHGAWRISFVNKDYSMCQSYPPLLLVPAYISDEVLQTVSKFRSSRRIPTVVWRHRRNGAVIARCSQPEVGWLGWRSAEDESLLSAIADACTYDRGTQDMLDNAPHSPTSTNSEGSCQMATAIIDKIKIQDKKKVLIMDARAYTSALANRARGGGCEHPDYYPTCEMQFMSLANIHTIRKSFNNLRQLCMTPADQPNWFSSLEGTQWLQNMSSLMKAAVTLVRNIEIEARPVLVHCSDGWDRTPQIVALSELLLDPFYRTIEGFRILVEREWLAFGHKFADRCGQPLGSGDLNERCPVFLQWLDCIHQLILQFPCAFEFSHTFLVKLAQHTYSNLFGTFLCNTKQERVQRVNNCTFSVWNLFNNRQYKNHLYLPPNGNSVLWPQCNVRDLHVWKEVYLGSLELQSGLESGSNSSSNPPDAMLNQMTKTRSYGDLACATDDAYLTPNRRKSDPNITVDLMKMNGLNIVQTDVPQDEVIPQQAQEDATLLNGFETSNSAILEFNNVENFNNQINGKESNCYQDCIFNKNNVHLLSDDSVDLMLEVSNIELKNGTINGGVHYDSDKSSTGDDDTLMIQSGVKKKSNGVSNGFPCDEVDNGYRRTFEGVLEVSSNVISKHKTDMANEKDLGIDNVLRTLRDVNGFESVSLQPVNDIPQVHMSNSDINHNGDQKFLEEENLVGDNSNKGLPNSIEASTETLTSDKLLCSSLMKPINGFDKSLNPDVFNGNINFCKVCFQNIKLINGKNSYNSNHTSGKNSRYSTPPLYSRTPSGNGWEATLNLLSYKNPNVHNCRLENDGLIPLRSDMQERLWQIIEEQQRREAMLQKEIESYKEALNRHMHRHYANNENDKADDVCISNEDESSSVSNNSCTSSTRDDDELVNELERSSSPVQDVNSVVDSVCSAGEGAPSAVESLPSDISWEALEEGPAAVQGQPTLWVPDHAVSQCTGCHIQFWVAKRKHHCRNCGRIFCANCTENSTPLPSEQLFTPVRVCTSCYSKLRRDCGEIPDRCKHIGPQTTNTNPRITASSN